MKKAIINTMILILTALSMLSLSACGQSEVLAEAVPVAVQQATSTPTSTPYKITLYVGDDKGEGLVPVECEFTDLTPQAIVDKLCQLGVFSSSVTVNSCSEGSVNILELDMGQDFAKEINSTGTSGEYIMMGSLVNSFLSVYGSDGLSLTVNGETLETGHSVYDRTMIAYAE